jgi:O-antigen/teichoic acid export membrane protein
MLARNALLNLAGHAAPLFAALLLVPVLVSRLDAERFGFLALAWALVGYFSLFDLGLGRALSRLVAERRGTPAEAGLPALSRTALTLTLALGAVAGAALFLAAGPICESLLRLSPGLQGDARDALRVLGLSLPLVTLTAALRGLLEAGQHFGWVNAIRVPVGILTFAAPLAATWWSSSLVALAVALVLMRVAAFAAHWMACRTFWPALLGLARPQGAAAREMLGYGAWLTISNVVGPLMVYVDRFVIAGLLAVSWVAYYSAPYELVTRLWLIPAALTGVLFPAMAAASPERLAALYRTGTKAVLIAVFPLALVATAFAEDWLQAWLGPQFAAHGTRVAQLLCLGAAVNCLAYLPFTLLQARGRADLTAKLHLAELPVYLLVLWALVGRWGIEGAAAAWALRCTVDAAALFLFAGRAVRPGFTASQMATVVLALAALAGALMPSATSGKLLYALAALALFCALGWLVLLDESERSRARHPLALLSGSPPR